MEATKARRGEFCTGIADQRVPAGPGGAGPTVGRWLAQAGKRTGVGTARDGGASPTPAAPANAGADRAPSREPARGTSARVGAQPTPLISWPPFWRSQLVALSHCPPPCGRSSGAEPGPLLGFLEWWPLVEALAERTALAEMVGEGDARVVELRRVLLVGE